MQSVFEDLYSKKILEEEFGYTCFLQTLIDNRIPYKKNKNTKQHDFTNRRYNKYKGLFY